MIRNPVLGHTAALEVTVGGVSFDYQAMHSIEIEYDEGKHDLLSLRVGGLPPQAVIDYRGAPVEIKFSTSPSYADTFIGYVEEIRPVAVANKGLVNNSPIQEGILVCMGVSYGMRGSRSYSWEDATLTDVVGTMADRYGFSYSVPATDLRLQRQLQHNQSDFAFLNHVVKDHGMQLSIHGTHIDVWDPYDALSRRKAVFYASGVRNAMRDPKPSPGRITSFKASFGRHAADGIHKETSVSVMDNRGVTFNVTSSDVFGTKGGDFPNHMSSIVDSYAEAENIVKAESRRNYDYTAKMEVLGIAGALPGTVVVVDGFNTEYDGYWYVRGVKHTITTGVFSSVLDIARNAKLQFEQTNITKFRTPPEPVYVDEKWRASRLRSDIYAT